MPVTVKQDWEEDALAFGTGGGSKGLRYNITGAGSDFEAWAALRDYSPINYLGFLRSNISVIQTAPRLFKGTVSYGTSGAGGGGEGGSDTPSGSTPPDPHPAPTDENTPLADGYEFSFVAEMKHKTQSLDTRYRRKIGDALNITGTAPDFKRAVGVAKSGVNVKVDGYDAPEPTSTWSRTVLIADMDFAYYRTLRNLVGTKNQNPFYGAASGECLLWSVVGRFTQGTNFALTFTFHERQNITNLILRPGDTDPADPNDPTALVVPDAGGWDHIWVVYEDSIASNELLCRPIAAYVEEIIYFADFSALRIGE